jgi:SLT domain-containing protein
MIGMIAAALILTALLSSLGLGGIGGLKAAGEGMKFGATLKDNLGLLGGFAAGGTASQSGFYRVGERGAETVFLPKGASVANAHETQRMMDNKPGVIAETAIRGEDLRILLKNVERKQNNTR